MKAILESAADVAEYLRELIALPTEEIEKMEPVNTLDLKPGKICAEALWGNAVQLPEYTISIMALELEHRKNPSDETKVEIFYPPCGR